ncbi:MAG: (2Fe-2S)-binding protein [Chloroflexi bacterium]|nr:MAG: (2Fe-2S)-binding protein [Chloroflexota bacterium]
MSSYDLQVNGQAYTVEAEAQMPLLWVLRDLLGLTGTKFSCGAGLCGSCTVLIDGEPTRSCITLVENAAGKNITTIEGLAALAQSGASTTSAVEAQLHPLQEAWLEENVSQCGYCQPGQIMSAAALLEKNPDPSDADIDAAMGDVLCRCGTYQRIRKAIHRAAEAV